MVCICTPVLVHPRHSQARNQFLALSDHHGWVLICDGLCRFMDYLSHRLGADGQREDRRMNGILDNSLVGLALLASAVYAIASLGPRSLRRRILGVLSRAAARAPAFLGSEPTTPQPSEAEVRVPVAQIGRRTRRSAPPA